MLQAYGVMSPSTSMMKRKAPTFAVDMPVKTKSNVGCSSQLDSMFGMLSTFLHLVKGSKVKSSEESVNTVLRKKLILRSKENLK